MNEPTMQDLKRDYATALGVIANLRAEAAALERRLAAVREQLVFEGSYDGALQPDITMKIVDVLAILDGAHLGA